MPVSRDISKEIIEAILKGKTKEEIIKRLKARPLKEETMPPSLPRETSLKKEDQLRRLKILEKQGFKFKFVSGKKTIKNPELFEGNIENYIGLAQIPVGIVGPIRVNGVYAHGDFYVPMATTEGALVASHNRGAKVVNLSGGVRVMCLTERVSRAPGFVFDSLIQAGQFLIWVTNNFDKFKDVVANETRHGKLQDIRTTIEGNHVYLNFEYKTGDAAGQNMVTFCTDVVCRYIMQKSPVRPKKWFIESNLSGDKKATALSYMFVRGKKVTAEVFITREICKRLLHTDPENMMDYYNMSVIGAVQSGSIGSQGHYANALASIFIACGQDVACVSEAAVGITRIDITDDKDLYVSVTLPNLVVGTVGGGTMLPTQSECLDLLGCLGSGKSQKFAEICAAVILGGEVSILGALSAGEFSLAHKRYGRKRPKRKKK
jgi:hydroxymethylglutaryl-CoA reductase (NADPH)